jgi:predicted ester cyclase
VEDFKKLLGSVTPAYDVDEANALAAISHPDMISPAPGAAGNGERGSRGSRQRNRSWFEGFPDATIMLTNEVRVGNYIVQEGTFDGTNTGTFKTVPVDLPATGRRLRGHYAQVSNLSNGAVVSIRLYFD